ncbi:SOS-response cell division inhibitor [Idiomarina sp. HP20-50]|uniref:SOS-response cell division inhibitor n=1 Tax=Idiomarina sp. HP20-50 TaxID=3070813 RepID=UPI00294AB5F1|nr:SOS-response cell division inhibitor [Idiomarina sp. HP20-50]MDV6317240.1 SOS-response cell division inhibitor [Idiomarina sp. HP20-50]
MKTQYQHKLSHPGLWTAEGSASSFRLETQKATETPSTDSLSPAVQQALQLKPSQWVTVIGGDKDLIQQLIACGVAESQIRWLRSHSPERCEWALEQALLAGTSSMVIGYLDSVSNRTWQRAKMASKLSETQYFLFDKNTLTSHLH